MKKAKEAEEKKSMEKAADKLGVSTEGKTKERGCERSKYRKI